MLRLQRSVGNQAAIRWMREMAPPSAASKRGGPASSVPMSHVACTARDDQPAVERPAVDGAGNEIVQHDLFDDFGKGVSSLGSAVSSGVAAVGEGVTSAAHAVEGAIGSGVAAVGTGVAAVGSAVEGGVNAVGQAVGSVGAGLGNAAQVLGAGASGAVDWLLTEAGKLALRAANALAAKFGGKVIVSPDGGIDIVFADIEIAELDNETIVLPLGVPYKPLFDVPFTVGTFVINTSVGSVIGDPAVTVAAGPVRLQQLKLHLDPGTSRYAGQGQLFLGAEVVGTAENAPIEARVQAIGVLPFEVPIPIEASAAVGIRDILRVAGRESLQQSVNVSFANGAFQVDALTDLRMGALAQIDHEAFVRVEIEGLEVCSVIWPLSSRRLVDQGVQLTLPVAVDGQGERIVGRVGKPVIGDIPVDDIQTSLVHSRPPDHCIKLQELAPLLCKLGKLPREVCSVVDPKGDPQGGAPLGPIPFGPAPAGPGTVGPLGGPPGGSGPLAGPVAPQPSGPCPTVAPASVLLGLPALKAPDLDAYAARIGSSQPLQHRVGRNGQGGRSPTGQLTFWRSVVRNRIPPAVRQRGLALGLTLDELVIPYWSRRRVLGAPMEVDHIVEMQVAPLANPGSNDVLANYQLMDGPQNGSSGSEMRSNIDVTRKTLANLANDPAWESCDMTFDQVAARGAAVRDVWTLDEITSGAQLDAFEALGRPPRP